MFYKKNLLWLGILLLVGCTVKYEITMTPVDGGLQRETVVAGSETDNAENLLTKVYGESAEKTVNPPDGMMFGPTKEHTWSGSVSGSRWEDGLGGIGSWREIESPLGPTTVFMESIGGDKSIATEIQMHLFAMDVTEDFIQGKLAVHFEGDPLLPKMQTLLHDRILPDAKDGALMVLNNWGTFANEENESTQRLDEFVTSFLWQRGWIDNAEANMFVLGLSERNNVGSQLPPEDSLFWSHLIMKALDLPMNDSGVTRVRTLLVQLEELFTEEFFVQLTNHVHAEIDATGGSSANYQVAFESLTKAMGYKYSVDVILECHQKPDVTNGEWDEKTKEITFYIESSPSSLGILAPPVTWIAYWGNADPNKQKDVFGSIPLHGSELVGFCLAWDNASERNREKVLTSLATFKTKRKKGDMVDAQTEIAYCIHVLTN